MTLKISQLTPAAALAGTEPVELGIAGDKSATTAQIASLSTPGFKNYLINGDFAINQRGFAGGALAAGVYGFDRWKAGTGGCTVSLSAGVLTHTSGPLVQVIEAPNLAGKSITVSVEGLSGGSLNVNVEGVTGVIAASAVRAGVTLIVPSTSTGNVTVTLTPASGAVTYKRVQVELGSAATGFEWRPPQVEIDMCLRYYLSTYDLGVAPGTPNANASLSTFVVGNQYFPIIATLLFPVPMRAVGALTGYSPKSGASGQCYRNNSALDAPVYAPGASAKSVTWAVNSTSCTSEGLQFNFTVDAEL